MAYTGFTNRSRHTYSLLGTRRRNWVRLLIINRAWRYGTSSYTMIILVVIYVIIGITSIWVGRTILFTGEGWGIEKVSRNAQFCYNCRRDVLPMPEKLIKSFVKGAHAFKLGSHCGDSIGNGFTIDAPSGL